MAEGYEWDYFPNRDGEPFTDRDGHEVLGWHDRSEGQDAILRASSTDGGVSGTIGGGGFGNSDSSAPATPILDSASKRDSATPKPSCGERCSGSLANFDPATSSWRTSQTSFLSTTAESGERFLEAWPRSGSMLSGTVFPLQPSAPHTSVTGSSPLLPTPTAWLGRRLVHAVGDPARAMDPARSNELADALTLLPTPHGMPKEGQPRNPGPSGNELGRALKEATAIPLLPTPVANDDNKSPKAHLAMKARLSEKDGSNRTQITSLQVLAKAGFQQVGDESIGASTDPLLSDGRASSDRRLNPGFVEWMMGLPSEWSNPDCLLSATEFKSRLEGSPANTSSSSSGSE